MRRLVNFGALALGAAALFSATACVSLLPESEPSAIYRLAPSLSETEASEKNVREAILIERPDAPRGLAGNRIATTDEGGQISYIAGAEWISPTPDLVQSLLVDTFDRALEGYTAARSGDGVNTRYVLRTELRQFEAVYDRGGNRAPLARVSLRVRLIDDDDKALIDVTTIEGEARADRNRQGAIVDAFSQAAKSAAAGLADWTGEALEGRE